MRKVVQERVRAALQTLRPALETWVAQHLEYLAAFPFAITHPIVLFKGIRSRRIQAVAKGDFPPVEIRTILQIQITGDMVRKETNQNTRLTLEMDIELLATGNVCSDGSYDITPKAAKMKSWGTV
jgi:hypothetical protein